MLFFLFSILQGLPEPLRVEVVDNTLPCLGGIILNEEMKNHREILENVIAKGGLFGMCAQRYIDDDKQATQYIIELSEQCHVASVKRLWDRKLIADIIFFSRYHQSFLLNWIDE